MGRAVPMRKASTLRLLLVLFPLVPYLILASPRQVSVEQLQQIIDVSRGKKDADLAQWLSGLTLTERLDATRFNRFETSLPGNKSRDALLAIADQSAFLAPSASQTLKEPEPDLAEQRRIMTLVVNYVAKTLPTLPNFLATRTAVRFADSPRSLVGDATKYESLRMESASSAEIRYLDGREKVENNVSESRSAPVQRGLESRGEFGPILSTVLLDAARNMLAWLRWDQTEGVRLAVFSYAVPKEQSHFQIDYCCIADSDGRSHDFHKLAGYTGEMAVDPETGAIHRLEINADLKATDPVIKAGIVVEYGPVEIGGRTYICPVHGIALSLGQSVAEERQEIIQTTPHGAAGSGMAPVYTGTHAEVAEQTLLNDVTFTQYHVFRSETRVLAAAESEPSPAGLAQSETPSVAAGELASGSAPSDSTASALQSATATAAAPANSITTAAAVAPVPSAVLPPEVPEVTVVPVASLPSSPSGPGQPPSAPIFRTTARLVDVSVVAFDKKGNPVTDLKPGDFELFDNGVKQTIKFFSQAGEAAGIAAATVPSLSTAAVGLQAFSNRQDAGLAGAAPTTAPGQDSVTILMIDEANIAWGDLSYARSEIQRYLKMLPAGEQVGFYVMRRYGFKVFAEPETDYSDLAAKLSKWMPVAQDLAQAQEEEEHSRQQIEYVYDVKSLVLENGNTSDLGSSADSPADRMPRTAGDSPAQNAFRILPSVARHLATIPGHKSLIWISSDNLLADFSDKAQDVEKGDQHLDPLERTAREALNEAHTSIAVLDVSQLEAGGVAANLQHDNVQLNPTASDQAQMAGLTPSQKKEVSEAELKSQRDMYPGRVTAQLQQDTHPIQGAFRELAAATGGRALRRASDIPAELSNISADGRSAYLLSFTPGSPADDTYHRLTLKVSNRGKITLRYRTGYLYSMEPANVKDRFQQAIWQPTDVSEIALTAVPKRDEQGGNLLRLNVAGTDLEMAQDGDRWVDRLDFFLVMRDDANLQARVSGDARVLRLLPATHEAALRDGLTFDLGIPSVPEVGVVRIIALDENSGRMGTVTVASSAFGEKR